MCCQIMPPCVFVFQNWIIVPNTHPLLIKVQEECLDFCEKTLIWILKRNSAVAGRMWPWWLPLQSRKLQLVNHNLKDPHIRKLCPNAPGHWCKFTDGCNSEVSQSQRPESTHAQIDSQTQADIDPCLFHIKWNPQLLEGVKSRCTHYWFGLWQAFGVNMKPVHMHDDELKYLQVCLRNTLHNSRFPACSMNN